MFDGNDRIGHFGFSIPWASHFPDFDLDDIGWGLGHGKSDILVEVDWLAPERGDRRRYFLEGNESDQSSPGLSSAVLYLSLTGLVSCVMSVVELISW